MYIVLFPVNKWIIFATIAFLQFATIIIACQCETLIPSFPFRSNFSKRTLPANLPANTRIVTHISPKYTGSKKADGLTKKITQLVFSTNENQNYHQ